MKIALISYEYPPDTAIGGIATYTYQIAHLMQERGHQVEVFSGSSCRAGQFFDEGVIVHRALCEKRALFSSKISSIFSKRHLEICFDVIESPEIGAESSCISSQFPNIPLVVKLHTPRFLIQKANYVSPTWKVQARRIVGALRRGKRPSLLRKKVYSYREDPERTQTVNSDLITTPTHA